MFAIPICLRIGVVASWADPMRSFAETGSWTYPFAESASGVIEDDC